MSSEICIPAENNSADVEKRESETIRISFGPGGPWSSLVTAGMGVRGWGPGVPKGRAGGSPLAVSTREILANLAFAGDGPKDASRLLPAQTTIATSRTPPWLA
jgi:hypothetical protein